MNINIDLGVWYQWIPWVLVKLWFAGTKQENSENYQVIWLQDVSQSYSDPTPTKEQPRSILNEEFKCNIVKAS
jgi:hypothetical protein